MRNVTELTSNTQLPLRDQYNKSVQSQSKVCIGVNKSNGLPCRNHIASSKLSSYCYRHADQAVDLRGSDARQIQHASLKNISQTACVGPPNRNVVRIVGAKHSSPSLPDQLRTGAVRSQKHDIRVGAIPGCQGPMQSEVMRSPRPKACNQDCQESSGRQTLHATQVAPTVKSSKSGSFSMRSLLRSLVCIPTRESETVHSTAMGDLSIEKKAEINTQSSSHNWQHRPSDSASSPSHRDKLSKKLAQADERIVQMGEPRGSNLPPAQSTLRNGTGEMLSPVSSGDLWSTSVDRQVGLAEQADRIVEKYAERHVYLHMSSDSWVKLRKYVMRCLEPGFTLQDNQEYIYVFRHDGDYQATPTISLKIGKSKDVSARLRQWHAQCRYTINHLEAFETRFPTLLERLMHLEFGDERVPVVCRCGRKHREWFNIRRSDARGRIQRKESIRLCLRGLS